MPHCGAQRIKARQWKPRECCRPHWYNAFLFNISSRFLAKQYLVHHYTCRTRHGLACVRRNFPDIPRVQVISSQLRPFVARLFHTLRTSCGLGDITRCSLYETVKVYLHKIGVRHTKCRASFTLDKPCGQTGGQPYSKKCLSSPKQKKVCLPT
ncbi:hypothetical protein J6590_039327 [Homalodisca vitripennis]|nr:hypothetical protein J6590_039327 [Homalodisca vitripennis]